MYIERLLGPPSGNPAELRGWTRPFRRTRVAPRDALLSVGPITLDGQLVWPSTTDTAPDGAGGIPLYSVPENRVAGLYAPANGEFSTAVFPWPSSGILTLNVDAHWEQPGGTCDEKCQAYVMVAVLDAAAGDSDGTVSVMPGYAEENCVLVNINATKHRLEWKAPPQGSQPPPPPPPQPQSQNRRDDGIPAGTPVRLRFYFRDATLFGLTF